MPKKSAGLLLYRQGSEGLEVLLAHPGGPFWARKDDGAWSIPKGELQDEEDPLAAAVREFQEEMGARPEGEFTALKPLKQPGGKLVYAWAVRGNFETTNLVSNLFSLEWPPRSGQRREFPEVDRAAWFGLDEARRKLLKGQVGFLDQLMALQT